MSAAVVTDMPHDEYLRHPALSFSGAKLLLPPSCPARFKWQQDNPPPSKPHFDFGTAVHSLVLGVGNPIEVIDADDWRSVNTRMRRDEAYKAGRVPLLRADHDAANAAADAVRAHPIAGALFSEGEPEVSLFWHDDRHDVDRRARVDWLTTLQDGRACGVDLKTTISAEPRAIAKAVANYRYEIQARYYLDAIEATGRGDDQSAFVFTFVEREPPHLVTVCELDAEALRLGRERVDQALAIYAECLATDTWPAYSDDIELISLPGWAA